MCLSFKILPPLALAPMIGGLATADLTGTGQQSLVVAAPTTAQIVVTNPYANGQLQNPRKYPAGRNPVAVAVGRVVGSDWIDAVVVGGTRNTVKLLPGKGKTGGFGAPIAVKGSFSNPSAVAIASLVPGSVLKDVLVVNTGGDSVSDLRGSSGTLQLQASLPVGLHPGGIAIGTIGGPAYNAGVSDAAVSDAGDNTVTALLNNGAGQLSTAARIPVNGAPSSALLVGGPGTSWSAIITTNVSTDSISVIPNTYTGEWPGRWDWPVGGKPVSIAAGNILGDGSETLVVANSETSNLTLFATDAMGDFIATATIDLPASPVNVAVADVNHDGYADILVTYQNGTADVLLNDGGSKVRGAATAMLRSTGAHTLLTSGRFVSLPPPGD
jgi:hypothetical protein